MLICKCGAAAKLLQPFRLSTLNNFDQLSGNKNVIGLNSMFLMVLFLSHFSFMFSRIFPLAAGIRKKKSQKKRLKEKQREEKERK